MSSCLWSSASVRECRIKLMDSLLLVSTTRFPHLIGVSRIEFCQPFLFFLFFSFPFSFSFSLFIILLFLLLCLIFLRNVSVICWKRFSCIEVCSECEHRCGRPARSSDNGRKCAHASESATIPGVGLGRCNLEVEVWKLFLASALSTQCSPIGETQSATIREVLKMSRTSEIRICQFVDVVGRSSWLPYVNAQMQKYFISYFFFGSQQPN